MKAIPEKKARNWISWVLILMAGLVVIWQGTKLREEQKARAIAERIRDDERLRVELLIVSSPHPMIVCSSDQKILMSNEKAEAAFGWEHDELLGKDVSVLIPEELQDAHHKGVQESLRQARSFSGNWMFRRKIETIGLHKNGDRIPIAADIRVIKYGRYIEFVTNIDLIGKSNPPVEILPLPDIEKRIKQSHEKMMEKASDRSSNKQP